MYLVPEQIPKVITRSAVRYFAMEDFGADVLVEVALIADAALAVTEDDFVVDVFEPISTAKSV